MPSLVLTPGTRHEQKTNVPVTGWTFEWWETGNEQINQFTEVWRWWMLWRESIKEGWGLKWKWGGSPFAVFIGEGLIVKITFEAGLTQLKSKASPHLGRRHWGRVFLGGWGNSELARVTGRHFKQEKLEWESFKKLARCWLLFLRKTEAIGGTDSFDFISNRVTLAAVWLQYTG